MSLTAFVSLVLTGRDTWNWQSKNPYGYSVKKPRRSSIDSIKEVIKQKPETVQEEK